MPGVSEWQGRPGDKGKDRDGDKGKGRDSPQAVEELCGPDQAV